MDSSRADEPPDVRITADQAAAVIAQEFPSLKPVRATYLGEGCDSTAFAVNDELVFRFPKREDVAEQLLREVELLPHVARRVPVAIPVYSHLGRPTDRFPHPFGAYVLIPGTPAIHVALDALPADALATALAGTLSALHGWDGAVAAGHAIPPLDVGTLIAEVRADALDDFALLTGMAEPAALRRWRAFLDEAPSAPDAGACGVVHGDLAAEHVLVDVQSRQVTGVIDWSEIAIGDPAIDVAGLFHWGGSPLVDAVLRRYTATTPGPGTIARARYLAACRGVCDVRFGHEMRRREYVRGGLRALEQVVPRS